VSRRSGHACPTGTDHEKNRERISNHRGGVTLWITIQVCRMEAQYGFMGHVDRLLMVLGLSSFTRTIVLWIVPRDS